MPSIHHILFLPVVLGWVVPVPRAHADAGPETVAIPGRGVRLAALLWRPAGSHPSAAVVFAHGSGTGADWRPAPLGECFVRHGYAFLFVYRRGSGPSADQGLCASALMDREFAARGAEARDRLQLQLLNGDQLADLEAGLAYLRSALGVDSRRLAVVGHSFGGLLALIAARRDPSVRAVVDFAGGANSWARSPSLRAEMRATVAAIGVPVFFIHAANDYDTAPGRVLAAELARLGKPNRLEVYPPVGATADEGHALIFLRPDEWESDVFRFLDSCLQEPAPAAGGDGSRH